MRGCLRLSSVTAAAIVAALAGGCSPHVLVAVGTCPDGGMFVTSSGCTRLTEDLVGWWRLDESAGSTVARDSARNNDGTLVALDPTKVWVPGRAGGGLAVEGNGYVNVMPSPSIDSIDEQVTIAGWGYLEGTIDDFATIASREEADTLDQHYHISINSRGEVPTVFIKTDTAGAILVGTTPVTRQTWVHVAGTYDGAVARMYVDGKEVLNQKLTGLFAADTTPFILGANGNGVDMGITERFPGKIDEIMLYRRALSATEIAQLHDGALFLSPLPIVQDAGARE